MKRQFLLISLLCFSCFSNAQNLIFKHLMTEHGLSQNSIFAIAQDHEGFMWYGSRYGLNRYDGYQFLSFKSGKKDTATLSDDNITALFTDKSGVLWVGTANGLNRFNPKLQSFSRITIPSKNKTNTYIRQLYQDDSQRLWVATSNGLYVGQASASTLNSVANLGLPKDIAHGEVLCVKQAKNGEFWVGTSRGLFTFSLSGNRVISLKKYTSTAALNSLSDNVITDVVQDAQNRLWVGTENGGLNLFNERAKTFTRLPFGKNQNNSLLHHAIRKMLLRKNGEIWIGTQHGLSILNPQTQTFKSYQHHIADEESLNQNSIYSLCEDKEGSVWIGTYYGGVNVVYAHPTVFRRWQNTAANKGIGHNVISSIVQNGDNFWIGTEGGGLSYVDKNGDNIARYVHNDGEPNSIGSDLVKIVYRDKGGNIWVGTHGGGLNLFNAQSKNFKRFWIEPKQDVVTRSEIAALLEDDNGLFWIGSQTGLNLFKKNGANISPLKLPNVLLTLSDKNIKVLYQDSRKNIWIATTKGLFKFNQSAQKIQKFAPPISSNSVNTNANYFNFINEDSRGNIWAGLYQGGLAKYSIDSNRLTSIYTTKDGLPNDNVVGIVEDFQKQLWISTSNGLSNFDPQKQVFRNYTAADGLAGDEFNYNSAAISNTGHVFFGGYNGLTYFNPKEIEENTKKANIRFTKLLLFNKEVQIADSTGLLGSDIGYAKKLKFASGQDLFTIQFALLSYIKSNKNKYAYKLDGINNDWIFTSLPQATYTNLPSGNYKLLVKGANNDGVWSNEIAMDITILPPFYKTWWAFIIYALFVAAIVFFITRFFYLRTLLIKDEELHQQKINFFTNVSHEIRTHLTLITLPIERLIESSRENPPLNKQLVDIKSYAARLLNLVTELMDFRKAETNHLKLHIVRYDMVQFVADILETFSLLVDRNKVELIYHKNSEPIICCFDKLQMEKVLFNLVSNAFKFTPAKGKIILSVTQIGEKVEIKVQDTGRGISPEFMDKLFSNFFQVDDYNVQQTGYGIGLALAKHIVELHNGTITVESVQGGEDGNVTTFTVALPVEQNCELKETEETMTLGASALHSLIDVESYDNMYDSPAEQQTEKEKVLIIEDNSALRSMLKDILQERYTVITAADGKEGVDVCFSEIPDLVISDVMMPKMTGFEVCGMLKKDERTSHIPVILLTAKNAEEDEVTGLMQGADVYISKPFSNKILLLNVQNLLHSQTVMRERFGSMFALAPSELVLENRDEKFLAKFISIIEKNMENEVFGVDSLADDIGMSYSVLNKKMKSLTNMSVNDFSKSIRLKRAAQLLKQKDYNVYQIGYMVGYADRKYFSKEFKKQFGMSPSEFIQMEVISKA